MVTLAVYSTASIHVLPLLKLFLLADLDPGDDAELTLT